MYSTDMYRTLRQKATEYTFFYAHRDHSHLRIDLMVGHKTSLNTFKNAEIISSIFSYHSGMKLEMLQEENWKIHKYVDIK